MMGVFSFVVFATENALDFEDYDKPFKTRTKIIQARNAKISAGPVTDNDATLYYKIELTPNSDSAADNYMQNPWEPEEITAEMDHLTVHKYEVVENRGALAVDEFFAQGSLRLADFMYVRQRIVYDFITFVAEVCGFADLFMLGFGFLLGTFYQPYMMEASILKHMGAVKLPKSDKKDKPDGKD